MNVLREPVSFEDAYRLLCVVGPYIGKRCRELDEAALLVADTYRKFYYGKDAGNAFRKLEVLWAMRAFLRCHPNALWQPPPTSRSSRVHVRRQFAVNGEAQVVSARPRRGSSVDVG